MQRRTLLASLAATAAVPRIGRAQNATPGVTASEIKIGHTIPYSGPASAYGVIGKGHAAFFKMVNDQGGVGGRRINFVSLDDGYVPAKTVEQTRRLVEQDEVAFLFNPLGTLTNSAIQRYVNQKKVPHLFLSTGADKWANPKDFPYTIGWQPSYRTEAIIYARHIIANRPAARVALIYQNDDFGKDYLNGAREGFGPLFDKMVVKVLSYEPTDATIDSQAVSLKDSGADVLITAAIPKFAAQMIRKVFDMGWRPVHYMSNVSSSVGAVLNPAGPEKAVGMITSAYLKDPTDPTWKDDAGMNTWRVHGQVHPRRRPDRRRLHLLLRGVLDAAAGAEAMRHRFLAREHHEAGDQHQGPGPARDTSGHQRQHHAHQLPPDPADAAVALDRLDLAAVRRRDPGNGRVAA